MLYLGIDGGGSKTTGIVADRTGRVVRAASEGCGNVAVLGKERLRRVLGALLDRLLVEKRAGDVKRAVFGLAGAGRSEQSRTARAVIEALGLRRFRVMTDAELVYRSILGETPGVLVSAGTGSICLVRRADGRFRQLGGWGHLLGDEGSGYDLGRGAMALALRAAEQETEPARLAREILAFYGVESPAALVTRVYSTTHPQALIASSAARICELAAAGDPDAVGLVRAAAEALLGLCRRGIACLGGEPPHKVALAGGLLGEGSPVRAAFRALAGRPGRELDCLTGTLAPAAAAVLMAVAEAGETPADDLRAALEKLRL